MYVYDKTGRGYNVTDNFYMLSDLIYNQNQREFVDLNYNIIFFLFVKTNVMSQSKNIPRSVKNVAMIPFLLKEFHEFLFFLYFFKKTNTQFVLQIKLFGILIFYVKKKTNFFWCFNKHFSFPNYNTPVLFDNNYFHFSPSVHTKVIIKTELLHACSRYRDPVVHRQQTLYIFY